MVSFSFYGKVPKLLKIVILFIFFVLYSTITVNANTAAGIETLIGIVGDGFVLLAADSSVSQSIVLTSTQLDKIAILHENDIAAAAAGDSADAHALLTTLRESCTIAEFESGPGIDVTYVDCSPTPNTASSSESSNIIQTATSTTEVLPVDCVAELARYLIQNEGVQVCLLIAGMKDYEDEDDDEISYTSSLVQKQIHSIASSSSPGWIHSKNNKNNRVSDTLIDNNLHIDKQTTKQKRELLMSFEEKRKVPVLYWLDEYGALQRVSYGVHGYASVLLWSILDRGYRPNMNLHDALELLYKCLSQLRERYSINSQPGSNDNKKPRFCIKCIDKNGCKLIYNNIDE